MLLRRIAAAAFISAVSSCALDQPVSLREQGICRTRQTSRHWALRSAYGHQYSEPPGRNHYRLITHLAEKFTIACGAQGLKVCDVGTNHGDSVRAWVSGSPSAQVATFDLEDSPANIAKNQRKWGGPAAAHTSAGVRDYFGPNVTFYRGDLQKDAALFRTCANSTLMLLDTAHFPETDPFEVSFVKALHTARYKGVVLMDDIRLGRQMKGFWAWVVEFAQQHGYDAHDLTRVGHFSGTGLLDFSGGKLLRNLVGPAPPARCNCEPATVQSCRGPAPPAEKRKHCSIVKTGASVRCA